MATFSDYADEYGEGGSPQYSGTTTLDTGSPTVEEQVTLLREKQLLAIEERKKWESRRACREKELELLQRRARLKQLHIRLEREQRLQLEKTTEASTAHLRLEEAKGRVSDLVTRVIEFMTKTQDGVFATYEQRELESLMQEVMRDNPELICPDCMCGPTKILLDSIRFCRHCGWKGDD